MVCKNEVIERLNDRVIEITKNAELTKQLCRLAFIGVSGSAIISAAEAIVLSHAGEAGGLAGSKLAKATLEDSVGR